MEGPAGMTIRDDIERERTLRRQRKPTRVYKADGLRAIEVHGKKLIYCSNCKGPVVDTVRAKEIHADKNLKCRAAMGVE
jgi:predicted RNA-binding protein with PUA-like domain